MAEHRSHREDFLDLDEDPSTPAAAVEQIDDQVAQAQERLLAQPLQLAAQQRGLEFGHARVGAEVDVVVPGKLLAAPSAVRD